MSSTRRQFLSHSFKAILAGTAAAGSLATLQAVESSADSPATLPPFGPPDRTAVIDKWAEEIDQTIIALEKLWTYLREARTLPPGQVNGINLLDLEEQARNAMDDLESNLNDGDKDDLYEAATGKRGYFWCISRDIIGNPKLNLAFVQGEINAFRADYPAQAAQLQAMLNARREAVTA